LLLKYILKTIFFQIYFKKTFEKQNKKEEARVSRDTHPPTLLLQKVLRIRVDLDPFPAPPFCDSPKKRKGESLTNDIDA
jgi:hypothetical protein